MQSFKCLIFIGKSKLLSSSSYNPSDLCTKNIYTYLEVHKVSKFGDLGIQDFHNLVINFHLVLLFITLHLKYTSINPCLAKSAYSLFRKQCRSRSVGF